MIPLVSCLVFGACRATVDEKTLEIGGAVQLLAATKSDLSGPLASDAFVRIEKGGSSALPYLEAALHTATPSGRRHLVAAIARLGLADSAPLLGHIAAFDDDKATAHAAFRTLSLWKSERSRRALLAAAALRKVDEVRGSEALLLDP